MSEPLIGLYGKLPAHGDFIYRELPTRFINAWDPWLQGFVKSSQEQLGESWLDVYLTSPIWRFSLSHGVVDEYTWCGVVLPSVDRVGRYFPFSIAMKLPSSIGCALFHTTQRAWFESMEEIALRALDGQIDVDSVIEEINRDIPDVFFSMAGSIAANKNTNAVISLNNDFPLSDDVPPLLLDASLSQNLKSYSMWSTRGSEYVEPCVFYTKHLPSFNGIAAMLDGQWRHWQWQEFMLEEQKNTR